MIIEKQTINLPNAISLNEALIDQLKAMLVRLKESLAKCHAKFEENRLILADLDMVQCRPKARPYVTYFDQVTQNTQFCGWPYFKTRNGKCAELNAEAVYRKNRRTLYPHDQCRQVRVQWTLADKSLLLRLIKDDMIAYCQKNALTDTSEVRGLNLSALVDRIAGHPFEFNWTRISDQLFGRHTPFECQGMWRLVQDPHLQRGSWMDEEDDMLLDAAREYNFQNWEKIAETLPTKRSMFDCFVHYQRVFMSSSNKKRSKFTPEEDKQLVALVSQHKVGSHIPWGTISRALPHRTKQTLYYRYIFSLRPNINREKFSTEEDCIFLAAIQEYGLDFRKIANEFPNRTMVQLRSHYHNVLKRNSEPLPWTLESDLQLVELYEAGNTWAQIAETLTDYTRIQCRTRYVTISNFLKRNPNMEVKDVMRRKRVATNGVTTANWTSKINEICDKLRSDSNLPKTELLKLASLAKILDITVEEELIVEFQSEFTVTEINMLRAIHTLDEGQLMDIPMHKPSLEAFVRLQECLRATTEGDRKRPTRTYHRS